MRSKKCSVHQRYSMILGKSRKIRTFTGLDTRRFNDVSGHRIFHAAEKVRFRKNTGPDTQCICCMSGTRYLAYFRFSYEYGFVSTNVGPVTPLILHGVEEWNNNNNNNKIRGLYLSVKMYLARKYQLGTLFLSLLLDWWGRHFTWSSEPREDTHKERKIIGPSYPSYFQILIRGPASGIEPAMQTSALPTELMLPRLFSWSH